MPIDLQTIAAILDKGGVTAVAIIAVFLMFRQAALSEKLALARETRFELLTKTVVAALQSHTQAITVLSEAVRNLTHRYHNLNDPGGQS